MFDYARLEQLISESGKTKTHLCKVMGKPSYYLRDVFKQKTAIPADLQEILAKELETTVSYLNGEEENKKSPAPEGAELIPGYSDLSEEEKKKVSDYIDLLLAARQKE